MKLPRLLLLMPILAGLSFNAYGTTSEVCYWDSIGVQTQCIIINMGCEHLCPDRTNPSGPCIWNEKTLSGSETGKCRKIASQSPIKYSVPVASKAIFLNTLSAQGLIGNDSEVIDAGEGIGSINRQIVNTVSYYIPHVSLENLNLSLYAQGINFSISDLAPANIVDILNAPWTAWLNRDGPGGSGDYETIHDFVNSGQLDPSCANPIHVECQTTSGTDWRLTGETYFCDTNSGGVCRNSQQSDGSCQNYQVRFKCP